jgi:acylphosphatase
VSQPELVERRRVHYRGTVQGVGFRYTTQRTAARFRVAGSVQNLSDGRVLVVAQGQPEELDRFLAAVMDRLGNYVDGVSVQSEPAEEGLCGFEVRF